MSAAELRENGMMAHLIVALSQEKDIGHYGRLVFVMAARHFLSESELFNQLKLDASLDEEKARALKEQVGSKGIVLQAVRRCLSFKSNSSFPSARIQKIQMRAMYTET